MISDQTARQRIVEDLETSFAVDAGAGTGKTTLLIDRLSAVLLQAEIPLSRVAAITFTDKAAGELVERLRQKLEKALGEEGDPAEVLKRKKMVLRALKDLEQAPVSTIHSFCSSILREYPIEAGIDPQFKVLDQVQADAFEAQTWDDWLKANLLNPVEALIPFLNLGGSLAQVEKVKDFLLSHRALAARPPVPEQPSASRLIAELKTFARSIPEILAACENPEDKFFEQLGSFKKQWDVLADSPGAEDAVRLSLLELPKPKAGTKGNWDEKTLRSARNDAAQVGEAHQLFAAQVKDRALWRLVDWLWAYLGDYTQKKNHQGFLDFDDLLAKTRDLLRMPGELREELKSRFDRIFVDEFQDTDPLQVEVVFFLCEKKGGRAKKWQEVQLEAGKLFLVGDPKQSIYRFRRADIEIYEEAKQKLKASGGQVEDLTQNFRTLEPVVDWVNAKFSALLSQGSLTYVPQKAHRALTLHSQNLPPLLKLQLPPFPEDATVAQKRRLEAESVAAFLKETLFPQGFLIEDSKTKAMRPLRPGDVAILFRELSNSETVYEEALRKRTLPYQMVGGKRFFNRPEIAALQTLLSALASPADEASLVALLRSFLFGFTDEELFVYRSEGGLFQYLIPGKKPFQRAFRLLRGLYQDTRDLAPSEVLRLLYDRTSLIPLVAAQPHGEQRVANLLKVVDQARDLETSQNFSVGAFTRWLREQQSEETMEGEAPGPESAGDRITLMTLHKAKGLEFPLVILSGIASQGSREKPPILNRRQGNFHFKVGEQKLGLQTLGYHLAAEEEEAQDDAEKLRLLYVGCTRARDGLLLPLADAEEESFLDPLKSQETWKAFAVFKTPSESIELRDPPALVVDLNEKEKESPEVLESAEFFETSRRARKTAALKPGSRLFQTVTELAHVADEKGSAESWEAEEQEDAVYSPPGGGKALGVLTHRLLEKGWNWDAAQMEKAARAWAPGEGLGIEQALEAAQLASRALKHPLLQRARQSPTLFKELPLTQKQENGIFIKATMDLVFFEPEGWVIVDYKTDRDPHAQREAYGKQIELYARLLKDATGFSVKEAGLYFLRQDGPEAWTRIK
jgi:ATP-dependent helicase/nuclease subunit A